MILHRFKLASGLRRAREDDIRSAVAWMKLHGGHGHHPHPHVSSDAYESSDSKDGCTVCSSSEESELSGMESEGWIGEIWNEDNLKEYVLARPDKCVVVIDGYVVDVTKYMSEHVSYRSHRCLKLKLISWQPGGAIILREYSERLDAPDRKEKVVKDANSAFHGGLNNHSRAARRRMAQMRLARVIC